MNIPKLTYTAAAYFAAEEKYPDGLANALMQDGKAGLEAVCWALSELSTQTELIRRDMGYEKRPILPPEYFALRLKLPEFIEAKEAILMAMNKGLNLTDEKEEIDEVLQELEQKKTENAE